MRLRTVLKPVLIAGLVLSGVGLAAAADSSPAARGGETLGMTAILVRFAHHSGADDCAKIGPNSTDIWLEKYATPQEKARLTKPDADDDELQTLANNAPGYSDLCSSP